MILRIRQPDLPRKFKAPGGPFVIPLLGALSSGMLICTATIATILRLVGWMIIGLVIFFLYGRQGAHRVRMAKAAAKEVSYSKCRDGVSRQNAGDLMVKIGTRPYNISCVCNRRRHWSSVHRLRARVCECEVKRLPHRVKGQSPGPVTSQAFRRP